MASLASALSPSASASFASNSKSNWNNLDIIRLWGRVGCGVCGEFLLILIFRYGQTSASKKHYKMQNNYCLSGFNKWPNTSSWGSVRIYLRGYLFVWLQYLVSKEEFLFLNSPRGFRSSLGQRAHFIRFDGFNQPLSFLSHLYQQSSESFMMLVFEAQPTILTFKMKMRWHHLVTYAASLYLPPPQPQLMSTPVLSGELGYDWTAFLDVRRQYVDVIEIR